jgi:zinc protease
MKIFRNWRENYLEKRIAAHYFTGLSKITNKINMTNQPAIQTIEAVSFPEPKTYVLDNGIVVHEFNLGSQEVLQIDVVFETCKQKGDNPLVLKVMNEFMGDASINYSYGEIMEHIDYYGAFFESDYQSDASSVTLFTLTKHLTNVLPIFAEAVLKPVFNERETRIHLSNAKNRFVLQHEKVAFLCKREFNEKLFGSSHRYGKLTQQADFDRLITDELTNAHHVHYTASNCHIIVSGNVSSDVQMALNVHFGQMKKGHKTNFEACSGQQTSGLFYTEKKGAIQSAIKMGRIIPVEFGSDEYFALKIINCVLGGYFGSRLMSNIREDKGYTYGINSSVSYFKDICVFQISTEVGVDVTDETLKEIAFEMKKLQLELIGSDELSVVKNYLLGSILSASDGPFSVAAQYKAMLLHGENLDFYRKYIRVINTIEPERLQELAKKYLIEEEMLTVVAGKGK